MPLPGVRTVLKDRFFTLSRTDIPDGIRVVAIARRGNDPEAATPDGSLPNDYDPFAARSEDQVISAFGEGSELHRAYLELVSGGAARVFLIPVPADVTDTQLESATDGNPFDTAFDAAETVQPDIILPWGRGGHPSEYDDEVAGDPPEIGFVADNSPSAATSFAKRVADKCKELTDRSVPVFGVLGVTPIDSTNEFATPQEVANHLEFPNLIDRESLAMGDNGSYVSVVGTELKTIGYEKNVQFGFSNGAGVYAGFLSSLPGEIATTGRLLFNISNLRYSPTRPQQIQMVSKGVIPVALNFTRAAVVVDGLTFGRATSDYTRLSTLRIVFDAIQLVRGAAQNFIGMPATLHHRNALDTAVGSALRGMIVQGALIDADFTVTYLPRENKAVIDLVLTPAFELRNIEVSISVQL